MITLNVRNRRTQSDGTIKMEVSYLGLDDEKDAINKDLLINGSDYYAMDTSSFYMFDEENREWLRQSSSSPSPTPEPEWQADISDDGTLLVPDVWQFGNELLTLIERHANMDESSLSLLNVAGSSIITEPITYESNGVYEVPTGKRYSPITVNVPPEEPTLNSLVVESNGTYTPEVGVDGFNIVEVNVPPEEPKLIALNVDSNGTYTPEDNVDGFNSVEVNVEDWRTLDRYFSKTIKVLKAPGFAMADLIHPWEIMFSESTLLNTVSLPNGIIGSEQAFLKCYHLNFACVKDPTLMANMFRSCTTLNTLVLTCNGLVSKDLEHTCLQNTPLDPEYTFSKGRIYVPDHLLDDYINSSIWSSSADIIHGFSSVETYDPERYYYRNYMFTYDNHLYVCIYEEDTAVPVGEMPPITDYRYNKYFMALAEL